MVMRWRPISMAAVILVACTGSGAANPATSPIAATTNSSTSATAQTETNDLTGEWQPRPLPISDATLEEMDARCLASDFMAPRVSLVLADARGEGRVHLIYAREDRLAVTCAATVTSGGIQTEPRAATAEPVGDLVGATGLEVWGGQRSPFYAHDNWWQQIMGEAGTEIHKVIARVSGFAPIVASLGGGWFSLWHPVDAPEQWDYQVVGLDIAGNEVATQEGLAFVKRGGSPVITPSFCEKAVPLLLREDIGENPAALRRQMEGLALAAETLPDDLMKELMLMIDELIPRLRLAEQGQLNDTNGWSSVEVAEFVSPLCGRHDLIGWTVQP